MVSVGVTGGALSIVSLLEDPDVLPDSAENSRPSKVEAEIKYAI